MTELVQGLGRQIRSVDLGQPHGRGERQRSAVYFHRKQGGSLYRVSSEAS